MVTTKAANYNNSQTSKNTMPFLLLLMSSFQQNWRRGQYRVCLKMRKEREGARAAGRNGPNNVCTYE
jgi:hypothetical protein